MFFLYLILKVLSKYLICYFWVREMKVSLVIILIMEVWFLVNELFFRFNFKKLYVNIKEGYCYFYLVKVKSYFGCGEVTVFKLITVVF